MSNSIKECAEIMTRMITKSQIIINRNNEEETKRLKELWFDISDKLDEWNDETKIILKNKRFIR